MTIKNRAFALAIGTGALVALSAPMASAASFAGPGTSGFNGDSVLNVSGNQVPVQACTSAANANAALETQAVTSLFTSVMPSLSTGAVSPAQGNDCTQSSTNSNTNTVSTDPSTDPASTMSWGHHHHSSGTSGFNGDSVLNLSNNQVPIQACSAAANINGATETQALTGLISIVPTLTTGAVSPAQGNTCSQTPSNTNTTSTTTGS
ncbi:MAG: hypothetical protein WAK82_33390 [Streptosporangiaceae bacterium]